MVESSDWAAQVADQRSRVTSLQTAVFSQPDPTADESLFAELAQEEQRLAELERQRSLNVQSAPGDAPKNPRGRFLGKDTTGLEASYQLTMNPLPTGAYHLMDPVSDPLLTVRIENTNHREARRVCVKAYIEGLSAQAVKTVEIERKGTATLALQPTLFPEKVQQINQVQRATLHVIIDDLDGERESHNTEVITCLSRTASFNSVRRPETNELVDLSHYYGAWVTPHVEAVQNVIRSAVLSMPDRRMLGYQGDPEGIPQQVAALFTALKQSEVLYVNSVIDYGAASGLSTQRTRLPRESLGTRNANCIDGTVLMASLLEGVSLNPAIVLVPGHAFVGWEVWRGADEWQFLETTMIGTEDFEAACSSAQRQYDQFAKFNKDRVKLHSLATLRAREIWPME